MSNTAHVVARLDDFPDGSMRAVEVEGRKILLVRRGADVFAMDGTCPHAGGPLAGGVLDGDRVICPWHKAAFDITSGANLEPPAVDDLCRFPVALRDGEVLVTIEDRAKPLSAAPAEQDARSFAIVGAAPVDDQLRLADHLYAAGDIAAFPYGEGRIRVEHWRVAEQQGRLAARNMLGAGQSYRSVPFFWTMQFMTHVDYVGHGSGTDELVVRGDFEKPEFVGYYVRDGRVTAAVGWGRDQEMAAVLALMDRHRDWTVDEIHPEGPSPIEVLACA